MAPGTAVIWASVHESDPTVTQYACDGHVANTPQVLAELAEALRADSGSTLEEAWDDASGARFTHGYVGELPDVFDLVTCEENGFWAGVDDGEPACTNVQPTTWATLPR